MKCLLMQKVLNLENLLRKLMKTFQRWRKDQIRDSFGFPEITAHQKKCRLVCLRVSGRQISQEDKNWEQNIQELQKKVGFKIQLLTRVTV